MIVNKITPENFHL
uniref:Uncharacterized protein n=1 Tax=Rhizophora mucronata TaxID=61149 RepID=A0A2P2R025_RHIMU